MERRYLVTAVAIIATFAGLSRGFHSLQRLAAEHGQHFMAGATCPASAAAQAVARLRTRLHPQSGEEAQLLAEMNVPIAAMQSRAADKEAEVARCATARAMREAERSQRRMMQMQEKMSRAYTGPVSATDFDEQLERTIAAATARVAAANVGLRMAERVQANAAHMAEWSVSDADADDGTAAVTVVPKVHCKVKIAEHAGHGVQ